MIPILIRVMEKSINSAVYLSMDDHYQHQFVYVSLAWPRKEYVRAT